MCDEDKWPTCFLDCSQGATLHEYFIFRVKKFNVKKNYFYPNDLDVVAVYSDEEDNLPWFNNTFTNKFEE